MGYFANQIIAGIITGICYICQTNTDMKFSDLKPFNFSFLNENDTVFEHIVKETNKAFEFYELKGWTVKFDKANRRLGQCAYGPKTISLSTNFVKLNPLSEVYNTIRHELAHAIGHTYFGARHHDNRWRAVAIAIGDDGERCATNVITTGKYKYVCPSCSKEHFHSRLLKRGHACTTCCKAHNNGKYSEKYRLVLA